MVDITNVHRVSNTKLFIISQRFHHLHNLCKNQYPIQQKSRLQQSPLHPVSFGALTSLDYKSKFYDVKKMWTRKRVRMCSRLNELKFIGIRLGYKFKEKLCFKVVNVSFLWLLSMQWQEQTFRNNFFRRQVRHKILQFQIKWIKEKVHFYVKYITPLWVTL